MALATFATISGQSPVGAAVPSGVDGSTAITLQIIAEEYVASYLANGLLPSRSMDACRTLAFDLCGPATAVVLTGFGTSRP